MKEEGITMSSLGKNLEKPIEAEESPSAEDILRAIDSDSDKNEEVEVDTVETEDVIETEEVDEVDDVDVDEEEEDVDVPIKINEPQHEQRFSKVVRAKDITLMIDEMAAPKRRVRSRFSR